MKPTQDENNAGHRPYPAPSSRSVMSQVWSELLFAHWPIAPASLLPLIPAGLELDTFKGQAWVGLVPFLMSNIRLFGLPPIPYASRFAELNVRTYVVLDNKPGVLFFSLDASNPPAVAAARGWYHLPYFNAKMTVKVGQDKVDYSSRRTHRHAPPGDFVATYGPTGGVFHTEPGSLEHWLTARYCLYAFDRHQHLYRGEINHKPWPLQPAFAQFTSNTIAQSWGIELPNSEPLLHYARHLDVVAWPIKRVK